VKFLPVGMEDSELGPATQMAVFDVAAEPRNKSI
jgi:hypothetical protein